MKALPIAGAIVVATLGQARGDGLGVIASGDAGLAAAAVQAIGARGRVVPDAVAVARGELAAGAVPVATLARLRRVREAIDDGWRAYVRVQIDDAQRRLEAALRDAEPLVAYAGGAELYADAALRLGAVLQQRKSPDAPGMLALALAIDPDRPITLAEFSPDVVEAVDAVRAAPAATTRLHVTANPADAVIRIDGVERGRAPVDVDVPRGPHLVVARAPLHHAAVQRATDAAELTLEPDGAALRLAAGVPGDPQALVDAALRFANLDEVVLVSTDDRRGGPTLRLQRCAGLPAKCSAVVEIGYGDRSGLVPALRQAWQSAQPAPLGEAPAVFGDRTAPPKVAARWYRSPYVWAGAGALVLGAVATAIALSGSHAPPGVIVHGGDY